MSQGDLGGLAFWRGWVLKAKKYIETYPMITKRTLYFVTRKKKSSNFDGVTGT